MEPDTERLRELLDKATPGPWARVRSIWLEPGDDSTNDIIAGHVSIGEGVPEADAKLIAELRNQAPALLDALAAAEARADEAEAEADMGLEGMAAAHETLESAVRSIKQAEAQVAELRDALRLIELFGYREGEDFGWLNAHMRGTATAALEGGDLSFYWRLFPNHRHFDALRAKAGDYPGSPAP
jgi:hypothetical protein